jgi:DNA primase
MTFQQACLKLNTTHNFRESFRKTGQYMFRPTPSPLISQSWQQMAKNFIAFAHQRLIHNPQGVEQLEKRGLTVETIERFSLGWNPENLFDHRERWGLTPELKENGLPKRQWLPRGIVIPSFNGPDPIKLKIRRSEWTSEDTLPKYVEISGSKQSPAVYGDPSKPVIIVESELDAILIQQEASHLICCLALGGVSKKPDVELHEWLKQASLILLSLDFDDAGKKRYAFWMKLYPNLRPWPTPCWKSPGDAFSTQKTKITEWLKQAFIN